MPDDAADGSYGQSTSTVVVFTKSEEALAALPHHGQASSELDDGGLRAWTDDYSDILGPFLSKLRGRARPRTTMHARGATRAL